MTSGRKRNATFCAVAAVLLTACGGGDGGGSDEAETGKVTTVSLDSNLPKAVATLPYSFTPDLAGSNSSDLTYSAKGLPDWARLDEETGHISGTPSNADVNANIPVTLTAEGNTTRYTTSTSLVVEPAGAYRKSSAIGFYATGYDGQTRQLRNDLAGGGLQGEVQFAQSHTIKPANNYVRDAGDETRSVYQPELVALRDALVLFIPDSETNPITVDVEVSLNGEVQQTLSMHHPKDLPRSDYEGSKDIQYSTRAWSARLPWNQVRNGLTLRFIKNAGADDEADGQLGTIDIGAASQLVLQNIRLGMLTDSDHHPDHYALENPVLAAADYFQTLPVSRLVMGSYGDVKLDQVILSDGTIYNDKSVDNGDVHSGDMREDVAKAQVSVGINLANYGVVSSELNQSYERVFAQITNHHAWGEYANGRVRHGLSGGNGIGTLYASRGNEASHEWGHNYGLGHYPGEELTDDGRWQRHHADSGWGYMAHRNRMRDNIAHNTWTSEEEPAGSHYLGHIPYRYDAMSGGTVDSNLSEYTFYTGYSARLIQDHLADYPIPDSSFGSGYKIWDSEAGQYVNETNLDDVAKPTAVGVPVATILGGYDPTGNNAVIYPVFYGNYGNLFDLPEPVFPDPDPEDTTPPADMCWVTLQNGNEKIVKVSIAATRAAIDDSTVSDNINKFHFNLPAGFKPTIATLTCKRSGTDEELATTEFKEEDIPELPEAAIIGQEHGYSQLRDLEMAWLDTQLLAVTGSAIPVVPAQVWTIIDSYTGEELALYLNAQAYATLDQIRKLRLSNEQISLLMNKISAEGASREQQRSRLKELLMNKRLLNDEADLAMTGGTLQVDNFYLSTTPTGDGYLSLASTTEPSAATQWIIDGTDRIHPAASPWLCLTPDSGQLNVASCSVNDDAQRWQYNTSTQALENMDSGQCMDYDHSGGDAILYSCTGNWNQQWAVPAKSNNRLLSLLDGAALISVYDLLLPE